MKFLRWTMSQAGAFGSGGGGGGGITTINGDTGNTGTSTTPTIYADNAALTCGSTVQFTGDDTSTLTLNVTDSSANIIIGLNAGNASLLGDGASYNTSVGAGCFQPLTTGNENCALGYGALNNATTSNNCVSVGFESMITDTSSEAVVAVGNQALYQINGASYTIGIGYQAGGNYSGTESNNIAINALSTTVTGENGVLRIGDGTGTGQQQLQAAYISGIDGVALTTANVVTEVSDQLGTAVLTPGSGITIDATSTPNQIIISASGGGGAGTITGNDSTAEAQVGGNWNILTSGTTMGFVGTSGTETLSLSGDSNSNVFFGDPAYTYTGTPATGTQNISIGVGGIQSTLVTGSNNIAIGLSCLNVIESDGAHIAIGYECGRALQNSTNNCNVMIGFFAGSNLITGGQSVFIGIAAGDRYTNAEEGNICINAQGVPGESFVIRIGDSTTQVYGAPYRAAYIGGIDGVALTTANVVTEVSDQLGTAVLTPGAGITIDASSTPNQIIIELTPSSERFKQNINPISDSSSILNLKPVTFEYKPNQLNISREDATGTHYGFIAEEVRKVLPNLTYDNSKGEITGVRYNEIIPLLLSEIQKLRKDVDALKGK